MNLIVAILNQMLGDPGLETKTVVLGAGVEFSRRRGSWLPRGSTTGWERRKTKEREKKKRREKIKREKERRIKERKREEEKVFVFA